MFSSHVACLCVGRFVAWSVGRSVGWLVGVLVGLLVGRFTF